MYSPKRREGIGFVDWGTIFQNVILPVGATAGGALATRLISRPSTPSQEEIENQIRLQHQLEIERMMVQQQQTQQLAGLALPAIGLVALVMVLS